MNGKQRILIADDEAVGIALENAIDHKLETHPDELVNTERIKKVIDDVRNYMTHVRRVGADSRKEGFCDARRRISGHIKRAAGPGPDTKHRNTIFENGDDASANQRD